MRLSSGDVIGVIAPGDAFSRIEDEPELESEDAERPLSMKRGHGTLSIRSS